MADIAQVTLPSGGTYDLKDASAVSAVTYSGHTVTVSKRNGTSSTFNTADTTYDDMSGATSSAAGTHGLVPAPSAGDNDYVLMGDGSWYDMKGFATSLLADSFSTSSTYAVGDYVIYNNGLYRCTTDVTTAGAWNSSCWLSTNVMAEIMYVYATQYFVTDTNAAIVSSTNSNIINE